MPNGLNRDSGPNLILVKTALDKLIDDLQQTVNDVGIARATHPMVYNQQLAVNAAVVSSVIGGGGYFQKSTDDLVPRYAEAKSAPSPKTTQIAEFSMNLPITRTFMADQQQQAVSKSVRQSYRQWVATRDRNAAGIYANGFTTQTTIDGVAWFSNSHVNQNGDTVDNLSTGALTDDNLNTTVNLLRTQVDQTGVIVGYEPKFLFTPALLHRTGCAVAKSVLRGGTGNNDQNYWSEYYPGMQVVYSPFLDTTSTTAYFIGTNDHNGMRFEREAFFTDLVDWKTQPNDEYIYKMRSREEVDTIDYVGVVGSTGA